MRKQWGDRKGGKVKTKTKPHNNSNTRKQQCCSSFRDLPSSSRPTLLLCAHTAPLGGGGGLPAFVPQGGGLWLYPTLDPPQWVGPSEQMFVELKLGSVPCRIAFFFPVSYVMVFGK